jgi:stearoyl-CoA desaturase (Delta-9 desaturase)
VVTLTLESSPPPVDQPAAPTAPRTTAPTAAPAGPRRPATPPPAQRAIPLGQQALTALVVVGPLLALAVAVVRFWGSGVSARDLVLAAAFYAVAGFGVTVGFHRLFTHRSFKASAPLKIGLAIAGSLAVEGGLVGWVANHRRHHMFADREGDPHSPWTRDQARDEVRDEFHDEVHGQGDGAGGRLRGLLHAHVGWFFRPSTTDVERLAPDLLADRHLRAVDRLVPLWFAASLAGPFALGWLWGGGLGPALTALLWAGGVRICLLHHVTWSINSVCHMFGRKPYETDDHSRNVAWLAVASLGESWHNSHHAFPAMARHGADRGQWDASAGLIRLFERVGWAHHVRWPDPARLGAKRRPAVTPPGP